MTISLRSRSGFMMALAVLLGLVSAQAFPGPAEAQSLRCLPTCNVTDGRFLAIAGSNLQTLSPADLSLSIAVPAGATEFQVGIFDGDGGESDGLGNRNWDGGVTAPFEYTLKADSAANGIGTVPVDLLPGQPIVFSNTLPDNTWADFTIPTGPEAQAPSGNYFYVLEIRLVDPALTTLNAFKLRSSAVLSGLTLNPVARPFSYIGMWNALSDISIVYPAFPSPLPTNYDGTFRFHFDVPVSPDEVFVWDGDFDHGSFDLTSLDVDDPDTPATPLPSWSTATVNPEGVAIGPGGTTGNPQDDDNPADFGVFIVRSPAVFYSIVAPDSQVFVNPNPSGNQEWERFRVSTDPLDLSQMDVSTPSLLPGTYTLEIAGVDMLNLNALLLPYRVLCVDENGAPCLPLRPFLVGDTVFSDSNSNGIQENGSGQEPGLAGVTLELVDAHGVVLATTVTAADGSYSFPAEAETYTVRVANANFAPGGPLAGYISTTGDSHTEVVVDDNVLAYDFGYFKASSAPGTGTIGYWKNHAEAWPVQQITVGGQTYTKSQAISWMGAPGRGDKTIDLFKQLVAAKLNVLMGNEAGCTNGTIAGADAWLVLYPLGSNVRSSSAAWTTGGPLHNTLDAYNNGTLCAPHRD